MLSQAQLIAVIGLLFALFCSVGAYAVKYIIDGFKERLAKLEATNNSAVLESRLDEAHERIEGLWNQIGRSSEEGMRKIVHKTANTCTAHEGELREHARELGRLTRRVFNGRRSHE